MLKYVAPLREQLTHLQARVPKRTKVSPVTRPDADTEAFGLKLAEHVAGALGTWRFIGALSLFIVGWMAWNALAPKQARFDPWPFMGDNLLMSMMAALTGPILLIAAAAGAARDHRQSAKIEQLAWDGDKQNAEIQDSLSLLTENVADMHATLADLKARISPPVSTLPATSGVTSANDTLPRRAPANRSHHKKVTVTPKA